MSLHDGHVSHDPLTPLNLPSAVQAQALKRLASIAQASTAAELFRAADLAEGLGLGLETVKALNAASQEGLYLAFEHAVTARQRERNRDRGGHPGRGVACPGRAARGARWVPVRSRRETVRTWASLTAVGRFADGIGLRGFVVEL